MLDLHVVLLSSHIRTTSTNYHTHKLYGILLNQHIVSLFCHVWVSYHKEKFQCVKVPERHFFYTVYHLKNVFSKL